MDEDLVVGAGSVRGRFRSRAFLPLEAGVAGWPWRSKALTASTRTPYLSPKPLIGEF